MGQAITSESSEDNVFDLYPQYGRKRVSSDRDTRTQVDDGILDMINQRFDQQEMLIRSVMNSVQADNNSEIVHRVLTSYAETLDSEVKQHVEAISYYSLLKKGSISLALLSVLSLSSWLFLNVPIINPFISVLCITMSPFLYWMGRIAESDLNQR